MKSIVVMGILTLGFLPGLLPAQRAADPDLSSLSLEQLTHMDVNTVSRREQKLFETPAAVYVITREDIRRSGATNVAEVLRMVPGVEVAQIDANTWAVSARGFNGRFANKMLIMIDNRSIYNPVFSGTCWDQNDLLLEDIERIEIVRGPGGTMWGANAVNGVINIVTSKARDTRGTLLMGGAGRIDQGMAARYGSSWSRSVDYQAYLKYIHRSDLLAADGSSAQDSGYAQRAGGRLDWKASNTNQFSFQGNLYRNPEQQRIDFGYSPTSYLVSPVYGAGGYLLGRLEHAAGSSDLALQASYSDERRNEIGMKLNMQELDLDFQHHFLAGPRNEIVWGTDIRWTSDHTTGQQRYFAHTDHIVHLYSTFFQDSLTLIPGNLVLTAGTKLLWNSYTKYEVQPRVSLLWTPDVSQTVWAAVSRAVRTPSDQDHDVDFLYPMGSEEQGIPLYGLILGNPHLASEAVMAYEAGYRRRFGDHLSLDLAGFVNHYTDLEATQVGTPSLVTKPSFYLVQPFSYVNGFSALTEGTEVAAAWRPLRALNFQASYAWMQADIRSRSGAMVEPSGGQDWSTPRNTLDARGFWTLAQRWTLSAAFDGNSTVPSRLPVPAAVIPGHARVDLRLARQIGERAELNGGVTNLLHHSHAEFFPEDYTMGSYIPRSVYFGLRWNH